MPELSGKRRLHGGTESASGGRVKAVSRASGGAKAPALTRRSDADTLQPRNSNLTAKTVASPGGRREAVARLSASPVPDAIIRTAAACPRRTPRRANDGRPSAADARRGPRAREASDGRWSAHADDLGDPNGTMPNRLFCYQDTHGTPSLGVASKKNRSISREASGPWASVNDPSGMPPDQACPSPSMAQHSAWGTPRASVTMVRV